MSCGTWCVYYESKGKTSACKYCSHYTESQKPRPELGKVDIFKLARLLKEKEEKNG